MKRVISALAAFVAALGILAGGSIPAQAIEPHPPTINGARFWTGSLCVDGSAINGPYYRVGYQAQQWNLRVGNSSVLALSYQDDCAAAGYPASRRMVVGTFSNPDKPCLLLTNAAYSTYNGMDRWTAGPGMYLNTYFASCVGSQNRRDHYVSAAIGYMLGLEHLNSSGYNSRVMNHTDWSRDNVTVADQASGDLVWSIYTGAYGG